MANGRHHGKGQHDQRHMAVPPVPGAGLVVIEAEFVLCGLEAVLDCPSMSFDAHQCIHARALRTRGGEERQLAVRDSAADQQATRPDPVEMGIEVISIEIGQIKVGPVVKPLALGARGQQQLLLLELEEQQLAADAPATARPTAQPHPYEISLVAMSDVESPHSSEAASGL